MGKKVLALCILFLVMAAVINPRTVSAGVDPLASPTPRPTERITAPEIIGINPVVLMSEGNQGDTHPSDMLSSMKIHPPELIDLPNYVDLKSLPSGRTELGQIHLEIPHRSQSIGSVNCGPAALGMALDYLARDMDSNIPATSQLSAFLSSQGLVYEWGTGVEELVFAARHYGFPGSHSFHHWNFDQIEAELRRGVPVVLSLGSNGSDQPGHFVTLTGINAARSRVWVNDPLKGEVSYSREEFLKLWGLQGNSGMIPVKEDLKPEEDFMLPMMGLFSVLSMFSVMYSNRKLAREPAIIKWMQKELKNPRRKGIGGRPLPPEVPEPIKVPRYEYKTVYRGIKTVEQEVPVYETREVKVGIRGSRKEIPQYEQKKVQVGFDTIIRDIPIYKKKKVQTGTKLITKEIPVTRYRTIRVTEWKKFTRKLPDYRYIGSKRFLVGYKTETKWKRVPVTKREAYQDTKTLIFEEPVYEEQNQLTGYRTETIKVPKYETRKVQVGTRIVKETEPVIEEQRVQVGVKTVTRQIPDYQVVKVPILAGGGNPSSKSSDYQRNMRLLEKLSEKNNQHSPPTGISSAIWTSLSDEDQLKLRSDGIEWARAKRQIDKAQESWLYRSYENVKNVKKKIVEISSDLGISNAPIRPNNLVSISAYKDATINVITEDGLILNSYTPPYLMEMLYVKQEIAIQPKEVITAFPGGPIDLNLSSRTLKVKLGDIAVFGSLNGEVGVSHKKNIDTTLHQYNENKYSLIMNGSGLTYKVKEEGVICHDENPHDQIEQKLILSSKCIIRTIPLKGILSAVGIVIVIGTIIYILSTTGVFVPLPLPIPAS